jgi:hypothetical protein
LVCLAYFYISALHLLASFLSFVVFPFLVLRINSSSIAMLS